MLQHRAATALDRTHCYQGVFLNEPPFIKSRLYLAAWLDGKRMKQTFIIACCRYLEMARG
jgi:hypothetical protein